MKHSPLKRTPMRRSTAEAAARIRKWRVEHAAHLAQHPRCEQPQLGGWACINPVQVHHIMPKSMGGTHGATGPLLTLCLAHHSWVESHRSEAKMLGLLIRREVSK